MQQCKVILKLSDPEGSTEFWLGENTNTEVLEGILSYRLCEWMLNGGGIHLSSKV
jgi:hypothetical protein